MRRALWREAPLAQGKGVGGEGGGRPGGWTCGTYGQSGSRSVDRPAGNWARHASAKGLHGRRLASFFWVAADWPPRLPSCLAALQALGRVTSPPSRLGATAGLRAVPPSSTTHYHGGLYSARQGGASSSAPHGTTALVIWHPPQVERLPVQLTTAACGGSSAASGPGASAAAGSSALRPPGVAGSSAPRPPAAASVFFMSRSCSTRVSLLTS